MSSRSVLAALIPAVLLAACAPSVRVSSDFDPNRDFRPLRSYAWLPRPVGEQAADGNTLLASRVERSVDSALAAKGFRVVDPGEADFFVTFHFAVDRRIDVQTIHRSYGYSRGWSYRGGRGRVVVASVPETRVREIEVGTLLIDVVDAERDDLMWRGSGESRIRREKTPEGREKRISEAVNSILSDFPPGQE
jgi:hypothetical protein